ncbi:MAG: magnesium transporter CorA family protein [Treponema sp.]|nr:magnesium transporter CorA family protein [Treponema sp.]
MVYLWQQDDGVFVRKEEEEIDSTKRVWVDARNVTSDEMRELEETYGLDHEQMLDILDPDELARIEKEDDYVLAILRLPVFQPKAPLQYFTAPVGIIMVPDKIITICWTNCEVLKDISANRIKDLTLNDFPAFIIRMMSRADTMFLRYLKEINRRTNSIQQELQEAVANSELIQLLNMEKSLTTFATSLRSNQQLLEKIRKTRILVLDEDDREWLDDVEIDSRQAMEMADTYSTITAGTMDTFASVISNNMNMVMKRLTVFSIALAIPTIITSFMGMNIRLPWGTETTWEGVISITFLCILAFVIAYVMMETSPFRRRKDQKGFKWRKKK